MKNVLVITIRHAYKDIPVVSIVSKQQVLDNYYQVKMELAVDGEE